jgi:hypothetical protein
MATPTIYGLATGLADNSYVGVIPASGAPVAISAGVLFMCRKTPPPPGGTLMQFNPNVVLVIDDANNLAITDTSAVTTLIPLGGYLDTWVLVTVTQSAGALTVFINGMLSATIAVAAPIGAPTSFSFAFDADLDNIIAGGFWTRTALTAAQHQALADSTFATGSLSDARAIAQHVYLADRGMRPSQLVWPDEGSLGGAPLALAVGTTPLRAIVTPGDFVVVSGAGGGGGGGGGLLFFGNGAVGATNTTRYLEPGFDSTLAPTTPVALRIPSDGTLRRMYIDHGTPAGNGELIVYTIRVNGVATALSVSIPSTSPTGANTVDTVAVAAGDRIDLEVTKAQSINSSPDDITATLEVV